MTLLTQLPLDARAVNTLGAAMGGLVMCLVQRMSAPQRQAFAGDLAALARRAEREGDVMLETLLIDLHRAAR